MSAFGRVDLGQPKPNDVNVDEPRALPAHLHRPEPDVVRQVLQAKATLHPSRRKLDVQDLIGVLDRNATWDANDVGTVRPQCQP